METVTDEAGLTAAIASEKTAVLFHTTWCPFCRSFRPTFVKEAAKAPAWRALEAVIDDESNPLWDKFSLDIVPAVLFFDRGKLVKRLDGKAGVGLGAAQLSAALSAST
jgi:thiol-disulfide isomerase/thioredoxin